VSTSVVDRPRSIALSLSQSACVQLHHAERIASTQFDKAGFRLPGRGVF
jgi:hypothetical protein